MISVFKSLQPLSSITPQATEFISESIHQAMVETFNVPLDDRFQIIARDAPADLVCAPEFLGIRHSEQVVFIQITCAPGRTADMKRALYAGIASRIEAGAGISASDVVISLVESARENWSFGNGLAQFAPADATI